jgi:hypothetical protein
MNIKRIAPLAAALALAACSGGDEKAPPPVENMAPIEVENTTVEIPTEAPAAPRIDNATVDVPPAETVPSGLTADEQTQDDADATGMTARVSRDEAGNDSAPTE